MGREALNTKPQKPKPPLEKDVSMKIRKGLEWLGYVVMSTQQYIRHRAHGTTGTTTPGLPDLYVTRKEWASKPCPWIALEVKRPKLGRLTPEQKALVDAGLVHVVTSLEEARAVLEGAA